MINKIFNKFNFLSKKNVEKLNCDILIHIGGPKSGSSAIQKFMVDNHDLLKSFGYYYPVHNLDKNGVSGGHWEIGKALINNDVEMARGIIECHLAIAKDNNCILIISAESFWGMSKLLPDITVDFEVQYIAFFRHPIDAMISNYNQLVKRHLGKLTFNEYINVNLDSPNIGITGEVLCKWYDSVGDRLTVYPYSIKELGSKGIITTFLGYIGVDPEELTIPSIIVNRSYPEPILEFKRLLNFALSDNDRAEDIKIDVELQNMSDCFEAENSYSLDEAAMFSLDKFRNLIDPIVSYVEGIFNITILSDLDNSLSQRVGGIPVEFVVERFHESDSLPFIRKSVSDKLNSGFKSYELLKLADLLGLSFSLKAIPDRLFDVGLYKNTVDPNSDLADVLRNLAILYEKNGRKKEAFELISLAYKKRPSGPVIAEIYNRLANEISDINE